jgi:hypothetical protein
MVYVYRVSGLACFGALVAYVYKHGWNLSDMILPLLLSALMFSLGANPERKSAAWAVRHAVALLIALLLLVGILYNLLLK